MRASLICLVTIFVGGFIGCDTSDIDVTKPAETPVTVSPPVAPAPQQDVAQKAEVGVGIKGDSLRNEEGVGKIIASPAVALFNTRERVVFEIQIPQALNLYQASEGNFPKTHEEFMEKIIKANAIPLPELKPGMQYRFRPDVGELWVEPVNPN